MKNYEKTVLLFMNIRAKPYFLLKINLIDLNFEILAGRKSEEVHLFLKNFSELSLCSFKCLLEKSKKSFDETAILWLSPKTGNFRMAPLSVTPLTLFLKSDRKKKLMMTKVDSVLFLHWGMELLIKDQTLLV